MNSDHIYNILKNEDNKFAWILNLCYEEALVQWLARFAELLLVRGSDL
jgi:hypothetical protein